MKPTKGFLIRDGSLAALRKHVVDAAGYWRELIGEAEYPLATRKLVALARLPEAERDRIYDADWAQYREWLDRA